MLDQFAALRDASWRVVDAGQTVEEVAAELAEQAEGVVARCAAGGSPLRQLWGGGALNAGAPLAEIDNTLKGE